VTRVRRGGRLHASAVAALAALLLAGAGCSRPAAKAPARVRFAPHYAQKSWGDCRGAGERCTRIRLRWPEVAAAPTEAARESMTTFIRAALLMPHDGGAPLADEEAVMLRFIDAYRGFERRFPQAASAPWRFERTIEPLGDTLGVACLAITENGFLGGAHPNSATYFTNFDLASGRVLRRSDLLRADASGRLDALGERAFRRVRRIPPAQDLTAAGFWFKDGRFRLNDNLGVTPTGLLFFFNDYEVGPHALGATSLALRWEDVEEFVRSDGPLGAGRGR
jgi:hypothetical protein